MNDSEEYIYLPDWYDPNNSTIELSHILCNNSPVGIGCGDSSWLNVNKRTYNKLLNNNKKNDILKISRTPQEH